MARGASRRLDDGGLAAQKTFFVRVENGDERGFGNVQPFAQEVDADEHVEVAAAQTAQDFDALDRVDVRVQVFRAQAAFPHEFADVLAHALRERRDERAFASFRGERRFVNDVLDLPFDRAHFHHGIEQSRRADDLLGDDGGIFQLERGGRRGDEDRLPDERVKFVRAQRAVFDGARQTESEFDEAFLAGTVAVRHAADLRERDVRFVDEDDEILREKVDQAPRPLFRRAPAQVHGIIFDAEAEAGFAQHFDVVFRAHADALRFEELAFALEFRDLRFELGADFHDRGVDAVLRRHVLIRRIQIEAFEPRSRASRHGIEAAERFDFVAEERDAYRRFPVGRKDVDRVAAHAERAAGKFRVVAAIERADEFFQQFVAARFHADVQRNHHLVEVVRRAGAVDAGNGGDDDDVAAGKQRGGGGDAQALEVVVHGGILFDVGVRRGNVGFRLVVVVVADEIFDGVVGEKMLELRVELRGERLVVGNDQRRALQAFDDVRHRESFSRSRDAEQRLVAVACLNAARDHVDRLRLVARRLVFRRKFEGLVASPVCVCG